MKALFYLAKRSFVNHIKMALKKPLTLIIFVFGVAYAIFIIMALASFASMIRLDSVQGLVIIMTVWSIYITLADFMTYSGRKGILFRPAHTHFVFTAPISPKLVLINSAWMNYIFAFGMWLLMAIAAATIFQAALWQAVLFFLAACILSLGFEIAVMVLLYANDSIPEKVLRGICWGIRVFLVALTLVIILYFRQNGLTIESAISFVDWPVLQMLPVVGWQVALYRLILLGPTVLNVVCSLLYLATVAAAAAGAVCMRCDGGYYEEAAKFADDYAELRKRQKSGELVSGIGRKKKTFRKIRERIGGKGAKAVFYRQLLEYKKEKYFIFSKTTLIAVFVALVVSFPMRDEVEAGYSRFFLLGIVAYVSLIMSGYTGKWENELKTPYLFLIPDTAFRKLWYSTLMEHIKALADGTIICVASGIFWRVQPLYIVLCILIYTVLQANKLYARVLAQCLVGDVFGAKGQDIIRAVIQMAILGMGIGAAVIVGVFVNVDLIFPILLIYSIIVTGAMCLLASLRFDTMEQLV
ncbi:hypothetical protein B5F07_09315 [Lachnoclostridium sp. An169]|uniref:putative ABC exporter domain-containing protein n=1 Tax=Lachnoclostridium sp. An169 TaxID=1965569 RepID=UPI000B38A20A|nr:putative ABC exporter domain-containing protein [Lachnoclostridium sp. An169]OUP83763.1 hypothetical protein B5F07_09315 [Lachnoclostridium sp. An169]